MGWDQYRAELVNRTPRLAEPLVTLKINAAEFLRHLAKAYRRGAQDVADDLPIEATEGADLFRKLFGGRR